MSGCYCYQEEDFLEGLCPWIPDDEENRVQLIFEILKRCAEDREAFSSNVKPIEGTLSNVLFVYHISTLFWFI